ncbi:MAG: SDR family NAD(P)-dependent oxidoreductase [Rhodocyclaceae bacterium]|nr:SDR family NAD(P)-dependent oxidoreductase [Rhodocyclaceae bacterium]
MNQSPNPTVVITGASSGIGRALAFEFAARGYKLGLTARRMEVLEKVREEIRAAHPSSVQRIELQRLDVDATEAVGPALHALFAALGGVDIVVVNAGINNPTFIGKGHLAKEAKIIQTNVIGAIATVDAAVEHFLTRGGGQIVGISSLASLQGIPGQGAYCASKAAISMYLDSARVELRAKNVSVTKILPGFILTDIAPNMHKYPFVVAADKAAREIVTLIERRVRVGIVPSFPWRWLRPLFGHIPDWVWAKMM